MCRAETPVHEANINSLCCNFQLLEAADAMNCSSPRKLEAADVVGVMSDCELCDDEPGHAATHRCIQCDQFMCEALGKVHRKIKATRHHDLQTIAEFRSGGTVVPSATSRAAHSSARPPPPSACLELELALFCRTCNIPISRQSYRAVCRFHEVTFLDKLVSEMVGEVERGADAAADAITAAQEMQELMSRQEAEAAATIKRCCRAVQEAVSEHENAALLDLRRGSAQAKKALGMQIEGLEAAKSALAAGSEYVRSELQDHANPLLLMGRLQELLEQEGAPALTTVFKSACLTLSTDTEPVLAALGQFCTPQFDFTQTTGNPHVPPD
jgi:hypothetical protein